MLLSFLVITGIVTHIYIYIYIYDENYYNKTMQKTEKEIWDNDIERIEKISKKHYGIKTKTK